MLAMQNVYKNLDAIISLKAMNEPYYKSHPNRQDGRFANLENEIGKNIKAIKDRSFAKEIGNNGPELKIF